VTEGQLVNGKLEGYGKVYDYQHNKIIVGFFEGGKLEGKGMIYNHDQEDCLTEGYWVLDKLEFPDVTIEDLTKNDEHF